MSRQTKNDRGGEDGAKAALRKTGTDYDCDTVRLLKSWSVPGFLRGLSPVSSMQALYEIEGEIKDLEPDIRRRIRQEKAVPVMDALHAWMVAQRDIVHNGSAIGKALDYSLKRWTALSRYLDDGAVPIDNNWCENQIRPWAQGRKNWLFAGSLRSGKRAAAIMSLIQSAGNNGHDPYAYLKDVLTRLPTQRASEIAALLPLRWRPA